MARSWHESRVLRHPRGAPPDVTGHGQGGRFRDRNDVTHWAQSLAGQLSRGARELWRDRDEVEKLMREPHMGIEARTEGGVARTERLDYGNGRYLIRKTFGRSSPNQIGDRGESQFRASAEYLASQIAQAVGAPAPVVVKDEMNDQAVYVGFVYGAPGLMHQPDDEAGPRYFYARTDAGTRIGLLDVLIRNEDRHGANWLMSVEPEPSIFGAQQGPLRRPVAIDHSETFDVTGSAMGSATANGPRYRVPWMDAGYIGFSEAWLQRGAWVAKRRGMEWRRDAAFYRPGNPLHPDDVPVLRAKLKAKRPLFADEGMLASYTMMMQIFEGLAAHAGGTVRMFPDV